MSYELPTSPNPVGPIGEGNYTVREGDCIDSLSDLTGHFWQTIWNHANNRALKTRRRSRNILLPGDRLYIPPRELKTVDRPTDAQHTFVKKGVSCKFRLRVLDVGLPCANENYRLVIESRVFTGTTDRDGWIEVAIPPSARSGELTVGDDPLDPRIFSLHFGGLDPITEVSGIQQRLNNLGFECGDSGQMDEITKGALMTFQRSAKMDANGKADRATLEQLKKRYGS